MRSNFSIGLMSIVLLLVSCKENNTSKIKEMEKNIIKKDDVAHIIQKTPDIPPECVKKEVELSQFSENSNIEAINKIYPLLTECKNHIISLEAVYDELKQVVDTYHHFDQIIKQISDPNFIPSEIYGLDFMKYAHIVYLFEESIRLHKNSKNPTLKKMNEKGEKAVFQFKKKWGAKLRKNFANHLNTSIWGENGGATLNGRILSIHHPNFALNKEISDFHYAIKDSLEILEFTQVRYRWYEEDSRYISYKVNNFSK